MNKEVFKYTVPLAKALRLYHRHEVFGLQNIPPKGRLLVAATHSLATYDISLLAEALYEETGRVPSFLVDRLFFKIPYIRDYLNQAGAFEGQPDIAKSLLENEEMLFVAPGGMKEALRPSSERYQIMWKERRGFVRVALETQTPIVVAVCPKADDIYKVFPSALTDLAYQKFKIPVFFARGLGLSPVPRPVKLTHFLSELIYPPKVDPSRFEAQLDRLHKKVVKKAKELIEEAVAEPQQSSKEGE
ncbi:MAG: acyltransferase family protein [Oligoflexales bacterium]|nr:acyltransferase family protein [Oligoflexales bacterium]